MSNKSAWFIFSKTELFTMNLKNCSRDLNFKFQFDRSNHFDIRSNFVYCSCLYFTGYKQGFWTYLYFRIRHSLAHVWTILNKMAAFGVIAHVRTILNKMASFGVNIYRSSASEHGQNITNITTI